MSVETLLNKNTLSWLLEPDSPGVRYLALRDLCDLPENDPELLAARKKAHQEGPIAEILSKMDGKGFWSKPGPGLQSQVFLHGIGRSLPWLNWAPAPARMNA